MDAGESTELRITQYEGFEAPVRHGFTTVRLDGSRQYRFADHNTTAVSALQRASVNHIVFEKNSEEYRQLVVERNFVASPPLHANIDPDGKLAERRDEILKASRFTSDACTSLADIRDPNVRSYMQQVLDTLSPACEKIRNLNRLTALAILNAVV